jgi:hypothetical protein
MRESDDENVAELLRLSSSAEYGDMLRLASTIESLKDSDLEGHADVWSYLTYLKTKDFTPAFVQTIAKAYWQKACAIVSALPYRYFVTEGGLKSERRLMGYLLRRVCDEMAKEK